MRKVWAVVKILLLIPLQITIVLLLCVSIVSFSFGRTFLNSDFVKQELIDQRVYEKVSDNIKSTVKLAYVASSFRADFIDSRIDGFLNTAVKSSVLQDEFELLLDQIYEGDTVVVNGNYFLEDYKRSIHSYVNQAGIQPATEGVDNLTELIATTVLEHINLTPYTNKIHQVFKITYATNSTICYTAFGVAMILLIPVVLLAKHKVSCASIPFLSCGAIMSASMLCGKYAFEAFTVKVANIPLIGFFCNMFDGVLGKVFRYSLTILGIGAVILLVAYLIKLIQSKKQKADFAETAAKLDSAFQMNFAPEKSPIQNETV